MFLCLGNLFLRYTNDKRIAIIGATVASLVGNRKAYELGRNFFAPFLLHFQIKFFCQFGVFGGVNVPVQFYGKRLFGDFRFSC